ncbi:MAG: hypothetical protein M0Z99_05345, partial [Betaproteobacteria bacterium]|nr:hypothetical protein [Betaproteobacteria bacterium]
MVKFVQGAKPVLSAVEGRSALHRISTKHRAQCPLVIAPYAGFKARVVMKLINKDGQERLRELTQLRKNMGEAGGDQK